MENVKINQEVYSTKEFKRDMKEVVWENRVQTIAVLLFFVFGIATLNDMKKKIKG